MNLLQSVLKGATYKEISRHTKSSNIKEANIGMLIWLWNGLINRGNQKLKQTIIDNLDKTISSIWGLLGSQSYGEIAGSSNFVCQSFGQFWSIDA